MEQLVNFTLWCNAYLIVKPPRHQEIQKHNTDNGIFSLGGQFRLGSSATFWCCKNILINDLGNRIKNKPITILDNAKLDDLKALWKNQKDQNSKALDKLKKESKIKETKFTSHKCRVRHLGRQNQRCKHKMSNNWVVGDTAVKAVRVIADHKWNLSPCWDVITKKKSCISCWDILARMVYKGNNYFLC